VPPLGLLPFLVHHLQREQDLAKPAFLGEEQAIDCPVTVNLDLPDVMTEMVDIWMGTPVPPNLDHGGGDPRRVAIRKAIVIQELSNGLSSGRSAIETPLSPDGPWLWLDGLTRRCHRLNVGY
jgi:hypothetical protein